MYQYTYLCNSMLTCNISSINMINSRPYQFVIIIILQVLFILANKLAPVWHRCKIGPSITIILGQSLTFLQRNHSGFLELLTRCVCEIQTPRQQQSPIFWPRPTQGACESMKCEKPSWWTYSPSLLNFKYYTLYVRGTELRTNRRTNGQSDDSITRCPWRTFQAGGLLRNNSSCLVALSLATWLAIF